VRVSPAGLALLDEHRRASAGSPREADRSA
jgi:hypothetical protein